MKLLSAIGGGVGGALALTLLHETLRRIDADAPRMDLLGMEAIDKSLTAVNAPVPDDDKLFNITMAGDILSNSLYYSVAAIGDKDKVILRGAVLGMAAGLGAVYLPKPLGLNEKRSNRTVETKLLTIALYLIGGLAGAATSLLIENNIE